MTPQERDIIGGIFDRLRSAEGQPRDPQAEAFIAERLRQQPYAPYVLAQAVYMQEQALNNLQQQIEQLQAEVQRLQSQPQGGGGFLSSLFGGGQRPQPTPPQRPMGMPMQGAPMGGPGYGQPPMGGPQGSPWGQAPGMAPQQRGGMGFLGTAAAAAVGVAGGIMAANALQSAFGGGSQQTAAADPGATPAADAAAADSGWGSGGWDNGSTEQASWDQGGDGGWDSGGDFGEA